MKHLRHPMTTPWPMQAAAPAAARRRAPLRPRGSPRPIYLKRVSEPSSPEDGLRVFVDRAWPRGMARNETAADLWLTDLAPSAALLRWYDAGPRRWEEFAKMYRAELGRRTDGLRMLDDLRRRGAMTLLVARDDGARNHALVLRQVLEEGGFSKRPRAAKEIGNERK
jgi:uncharacterized protein YeaO (DUF488 family)